MSQWKDRERFTAGMIQMGEYGSGESISVPMGTPHPRSANRGTEDLVVIEVSVGELEHGHGNDSDPPGRSVYCEDGL